MKKYKNIYENYKLSTTTTIDECYKNCSTDKYCAFINCQKMCENWHGHDLKIISSNCQQFSVGFEFSHNNKNYLCYITKDKYIYIDLNSFTKVKSNKLYKYIYLYQHYWQDEETWLTYDKYFNYKQALKHQKRDKDTYTRIKKQRVYVS